MKMLLVIIFALSCAQISNAAVFQYTPPEHRWFPAPYTTPPYPTGSGEIFKDCSNTYMITPGAYNIRPNLDVAPFEVFCDMMYSAKWTVIQQRFSKEVDFYRNYANYTMGFGTARGNHWLGLEKIHQLTKNGDHELLVVLQTHNMTSVYARYSTFKVDSEATGFKLTISGHTGTAGDSIYNTGYGHRNHNGMKFSTYDKDQDKWPDNCAEYFQGAWWYNACKASNLNGLYYDTAVYSETAMVWLNNFDWYALKSTRMMVRRK